MEPGRRVDGRSFVPFLKNETPPVWRKRFLIEHFAAAQTLPIPTFQTTLTGNVLYVEYSSTVYQPPGGASRIVPAQFEYYDVRPTQDPNQENNKFFT